MSNVFSKDVVSKNTWGCCTIMGLTGPGGPLGPGGPHPSECLGGPLSPLGSPPP